jgi:hypothetical protein
MTENLTDTIRNQFTTMRHLYAGSIATKLRAGGVADQVVYDDGCILTAWHAKPSAAYVVVYVADQEVQITFAAVDGNVRHMVRIAAPYAIGAVVMVVEGLLLATKPTSAPFVADVTTICCGLRIPVGALRPWRSAGDTVHEGMVYHCPRCHVDTLVDVFEVIDPEQTGDLTDDGGDR